MNSKNLLLSVLSLTILFTSLVCSAEGTTDEKAAITASVQQDYREIMESVSAENMEDHIRYLAGLGTRVTGYPGADLAAQYISEKFREYGLSAIQDHLYNITVPLEEGATITPYSDNDLPIRKIEAYTLWPNLVQTSPTSPEGVSGTLVYAGYGTPSELDDRQLRETVALMEFNSRDRWLYPAMFGGKAVIFIAPDDTNRFQAELKFINTPLYFPRVYVSTEDGAYLKSMTDQDLTVNIVSNMQFDIREAKNVIGFIEGIDPELKDETIILTAHYDSYSVVPLLAPGADEAAGVAALLELARFFSMNPPRRTLMFVAFSGYNQGLEGPRQFVESLLFQGKWTEEVGEQKILIDLDLSTESSSLCTIQWDWFYRYDATASAGGVGVARGCEWVWGMFQEQYKPSIEAAWKEMYGRIYSTEFTMKYLHRYLGEHVPTPFILGSSPYSYAGGTGFSFFTRYVYRLRWQTPSDTFDRINLENLKHQVEAIIPLVYSLQAEAEIRGLFFHVERIIGEETGEYKLPGGGFFKVTGQVVEYNWKTGLYDPIPNALVHIFGTPVIGTGTVSQSILYKHSLIVKTDQEGIFTVTGLATSAQGWVPQIDTYYVRAYVVNSSGALLYAPDMGTYGSQAFPDSFKPLLRGTLGTREIPRYFVTFKAGTIVLYNLLDSEYANPLTYRFFPTTAAGTLGVSVNDFRSHAHPTSFGVSFDAPTILVFAPPEMTVEILIEKPGQRVPYAILTNASQDYAEGTGYSVNAGEYLHLFNTPYKVASDLYLTDESRLTLTSKFGTFSPRTSTFHSMAEEHLRKASEGMENLEYSTFLGHSIAACSVEGKAYVATKSLILDTIYTVLFFFGLLIPFTLIMEKMIFSWDGNKRLSALILIFGLAVLGLASVHPGFRIGSNIYMTMIAVASLTLITPIIMVLLNEVGSHLYKLRRRILGVHFAEISRSSAVVMAFSYGASQMKKRRFRSVLMLVSICFIAFSMISLTSISGISIVQTYPVSTQEPPYSGIQLKKKGWQVLDEKWVETLIARYSEEATVSPRVWWYPPSGEGGMGPQRLKIGVAVTSTKGSTHVETMIGLTAEDSKIFHFDLGLVDGRWFLPEDHMACIISSPQAEELNLSVGDQITMLGLSLTVVGIFDPEQMRSFVDLDQEQLSPQNPAAPTGVHLPFSYVIIMSSSTLHEIGGQYYSVAIKFHDESKIESEAQSMAYQYTLHIYLSHNGEIRMYREGIAYSTVNLDIVTFPMVICGFTVLNLMLGSVYGRSREIEAMSTVGLSPTHVASMFLAESVVYAIISGGLGYIAGTAGAYVGHSFQLFPPDFYPNYSSIAIILVICLLMLMVIGSSAYPMLLASKLVTPSLMRKWKLTTRPKGDNWEILLPFEVRKDEVDGIVEFIREYFEANTAAGGLFEARDISVRQQVRGESVFKIMKAGVRIRPYEKGINQSVELQIVTTPETERCSANLLLTRLGGTLRNWEKHNSYFIDLIRKQLLIWGGLSADERAEYVKQAEG